MEPTQVRNLVLLVLAALAAGALGGYLTALLRPHPPAAWASDYLAPHPVDEDGPGEGRRHGPAT